MSEKIVGSEQQAVESKKSEEYFFQVSAADCKKIPGSPIAYWATQAALDIFERSQLLGQLVEPRQGMATTNNNRFLRLWQEVSFDKVGIGYSSTEQASSSEQKWFSYNKGGDYRKWYGNNYHVVNYENDGMDMKIEVKAKYREKEYAKGFSDERWDKLIEIWVLKNQQFYFKPSVTWTYISSSYFGARYCPKGFIFDVGGSSIFPDDIQIMVYTGFMCSKLSTYFLKALNPTLNFQVENIAALPISEKFQNIKPDCSRTAVALAEKDWNSYETSWDFTSLPLLQSHFRQSTLKETYQKLRLHWFNMTMKMQQLEEENNRIFIEAYGLQDELEPDVPLKEITLTCNPFYRYGKAVKSDECEVGSNNSPLSTSHSPLNKELEERLLADTMKEFISYAVGCMFGRYSLDKEGLILANQGGTITDYIRKVGSVECEVGRKTVGSDECEVKSNEKSPLSTSHFPLSKAPSPLPTSHFPLSKAPSPLSTSHFPLGEAPHSPLGEAHPPLSFAPDDDNVIPILDGEWFTDDVTERFRRFVKVTFGEEYYQENLAFIEQSIGKDIRKYFLKDFYADHVKRYKKRPIYWMFSSGSSGRGGSFNALIYMHRYQPTTASVVLNGYLREFRTKLIARKEHFEQVSISASVSQRDKTQALKEIEKLKKMIDELESWERDVLYPLAAEQIDIDLDDGMKLNYPKFGKALKKVVGLS